MAYECTNGCDVSETAGLWSHAEMKICASRPRSLSSAKVMSRSKCNTGAEMQGSDAIILIAACKIVDEP